jgi:hypothetical protein
MKNLSDAVRIPGLLTLCLASSALFAAEPLKLADFASETKTAQGGSINDVVYSEKKDDAKLDAKRVADGLLVVSGQVGLGKASQWAGVGVGADVGEAGKTIDASPYQSVTLKLAAKTTKRLRLRIFGPDQATQMNGCYPVKYQDVTPTPTEYTIPLSAFAPEGYCGGNGRNVAKTLPTLAGFEVVDTVMSRDATEFSIGEIRLNP